MTQDKQSEMSANQAGKQGGEMTSANPDKQCSQEMGSKGAQNSGATTERDAGRGADAGSNGAQNTGESLDNDAARGADAGGQGGAGNFAADREKASEAGSKGGQGSHGGGR